MACINYNLNFIHGDTKTIYFSINKIDGVTIDQIYYTVKTEQNGKILLQRKLDNGIIFISEDDKVYHYALIFDSSNTDKLKSATKYIHDIEVIMGTVKQTVLKGTLTLDEEVTTVKSEK